MQSKPLWACVTLVAAAVPAVSAAPALAAPVEFNRDVRPVLSEKCFRCHGPDPGQRKAGLRLDLAAVATAPAKSGKAAVVPGKPAESELLRRVLSPDPDERMPPASTGKSVTEAEVALLRRWIEEGARWQDHWCYMPLERPAPRVPPAGSAARSEVDAFILERLAAEGLRPSSEADRVTLIRRLSFDLLGLPPQPEEVDDFLSDESPDACERLADRLLASPAFGERMAAWWLDLARYADTVGYHGDQDQGVWPYRDYVIRTFNEDRPFDRFTLEQIAGDLLPDATIEQKVASGYNRLAMKSAEGGVQDKEYLAKYAAERVRSVSGAWMGATFGCAECHDHKYDPFTTRDFYRFAAFWADTTERGIYGGAESSGEWGPKMKVPDAEQEARRRRLDAEIAATRARIDGPAKALDAEEEAWERSLGAPAAWTALRPLAVSSAGGAALEVKEDGSVLASGPNPDADSYTVTAEAPPWEVTAFRLEALPDESLPKKGPGRAANGNFVLTELSVRLKPAGAAGELEVPLQSPSASHEQTSLAEKNPYGRWSIEAAIDGEAKGAAHGWAILDRVGQPHEAVFETRPGSAAAPGGTFTFVLKQAHGNGGHNLGRFRLSVTSSPRPVRVFGAGLPASTIEVLKVDRVLRSEAQRKEVAAYFRSIAPSLEPARKRLADLQREREDLEKRIPTMLVTVAREPRTLRVLARGNWMDDSGEVVEPGVPAFLPQLKPAGPRATRLDLARWLTAPENPVTARAFVNRLWKLAFGAGLSRRLDDLGSQGDWPSHPELLDGLAAGFRDSGWSVKGLLRRIVSSAAYRQASLAPPELLERDPQNRLIARQVRFRLEAEAVRDAVLAASGLLARRIGGPSAKPYQPPGYWAYLNFPVREWRNDSGEDQYRRGLYTHWQRQYLHPSLLAFDAPCREECVADRVRSNTPLQALVLLNDPTYVEAARALAERALREGGSSASGRLRWACREALSREPRSAEAEVLHDLVAKHLKEYRADPKAASDLLATGQLRVPADLDRAELAAWTSAARAILNLHETITRS
ncbi:MAG: PSD1 domain-containing protein [Planctomycetes bacterium]|nr:PSD1 domain-containing protein [Planctomycetota bacterium]